ncbi:MAG: CRTAC1 family protein [Planctomycetota bacterium]|nr:CRTAC1 family protein [Planctomycetota bacterium]
MCARSQAVVLVYVLCLAGCRQDAENHARPAASTGPASTQAAGHDGEHRTQAALLADATEQCGLDFRHFNGATGDYLLPEITGAGCALFDYDNDGDLDLYLVQGAALKPGDNPDAARWPGDGPPRDRLYRNDLASDPPGQLRFTDVTAASGIRGVGYGMGVATGDYDNDGHVDLYVTNLGSNQLLHNNGDGTFEDVTHQAGLDDPSWSTSATFFDYDRDGRLDLFLTSYVFFSINMKRECFAQSTAPDYCGPDSYNPVPDRLFHNRGDGTFEDVTKSSGIISAFGAGLGVVAADLNGDGWTDIYVANDGDPNQLWLNQRGSGVFVDDALMAGVALNRMGRAEAGMGVDAADFDGDGDEDLFMTHLDQESNTLYVNLGDGMFEDRTIQIGLHVASLRYTSFGTGFFDYDNDGWLDLLVLNGAVKIIEKLARAGDPYPLHMPNQLFHNDGQGRFVEVTQQAGAAFQLSEVSRGAAFGDLDNDGDTDVVILNNNGPARVLLNQADNRNHWLGLRILDRSGGRDSLQARVEIVGSDGKTLWRRVSTDGSYCSAGDPRVLAGLGENENPPVVRVHWPDGAIEEWRDLATDRYWTLKQGQGAAPRRQVPEKGNG